MNWGNSWKFALVLSIVIHIFAVFLFFIVPAPMWLVAGRGGYEKKAGTPDLVKRLVIRKQAEKKKDEAGADPREEEKKQQPDFVKTSAHQPKDDRPKESPHIGSRSTKASGGPKAPDDMKEMPAQDGEDPRDGEVVLFDQNRQDGVLDHDDEGSAQVSRPVVRRVAEQVVEKNAPRPVMPDPALAEAVQESGASRNESRNEENPSQPSQPSQKRMEGVLTNGSETGDASAQPVPPDQLVKEEAEKPEAERDAPEDSPLKDERGKGMADGRQDAEKEDGKEEEEVAKTALREPEHLKEVREEKEAFTEKPILDTILDKEEADAVKQPSQPGKNLMANERVKSLPPVAELPKQQEERKNQDQKTGANRSLLAPAASRGGASLPPPLARKSSRPVYDPVFSEMAQPGFRSQERRTRTSGRFSFGRNPSLDVAATPMGRYQEIVYRAIAMVWYDQCDRNRDLIVTGTLRIRILLNPKGDVVSMKLLSRSGASVAQNSFTFVAIKAAPIPPMPPEVKKELVGDRMELFFDFNF